MSFWSDFIATGSISESYFYRHIGSSPFYRHSYWSPAKDEKSKHRGFFGMFSSGMGPIFDEVGISRVDPTAAARANQRQQEIMHQRQREQAWREEQAIARAHPREPSPFRIVPPQHYGVPYFDDPPMPRGGFL